MSRSISLVILIALVLILAIFFYQVMIGFLLPLFMATLLAVLFSPLHRWFTRHCHGHDRLAAGITTVAILVIVLAPIGLVTFEAAVEANNIRNAVINKEKASGFQFDRKTLDQLVAEAHSRFGLQLTSDEIIEDGAAQAKEWFGSVASLAPGFLVKLMVNSFVMALGLYYFLADGPQLVAAGTGLIPLDHKYQEQLVSKFVDISRAVTSASIVAAGAQGILIGIGYYFAGMKGFFLLLVMTMLASFIPLVGSAVVWGSCCLWLWYSDGIGPALMLASWSLVVALLADNVLKPMVLHGQSRLHPLLALLSVLGGVQVMGPLGIFLGPMAVAFLQSGLTMLNAELDLLKQPKRAGKAAS